MTFSIDQALVTQFSDMVYAQAQQEETRLSPIVETVQVSGKDYSVERLDKVEAIEITQRHADTVAQDITHSRRQLAMREFRTTILLDDFDDVSTLIDPQSAYAKHIAAAMNRQKDRIIAGAAFADVKTGRNFGTTVTFANDDGLTVAASVGSTTGLNYDKLLEVQENFINNNVGVESAEDVYLLITGQQNTNAMNETELTSGDFTREYAVENGKAMNGAGLNFIHFSGTDATPVIGKSGSDRECIALAKGGIKFGVSKDMTLTINERPDKNNLIQLQACMYIGAVRCDGRRVQKVVTTEA
jgi:hypothetical protein